MLSIHLDEDVDGSGGSVTDLAAGLEEAARALAPGRVLSTALAGLLVSHGGSAAARELLPRLGSGRLTAGVALSPRGLRADPGGAELRVSGAAPAVPDAGVADVLIVGARIPEGEQSWWLAQAAETGAADQPVTRDRLGDLIARGHAASMLGLRATARSLRGDGPGPESGVAKLVGTEHRQAVAETAWEVLGPEGVAMDDRSEPVVHELLLSRCRSIAGGTTQVLRTLVGERALGLPRELA